MTDIFRKDLERLISIISKNELEDYYKLHTKQNTADRFNISVAKLNALIEHYSIIKTKEDLKRTKEQTCLERFGVKNPFQLPENIKRGKDNPSCKPEVIDKIRQTKLKNNSYQLSVVKGRETRIKNSGSLEASYRKGVEKQQQNLSKKFGSLEDAYKHQQESRLKYFQDTYGVDNPFQLEEVKEKIRKTNLEKYGVDYFTKSDDFQQLSNKTRLEKYGIENWNNWKKGHETRIKNSGSLEESYKQGFEVQKQTMLDRYGYECILVSPEIESHTKKKHSKPNEYFASLLDRLNIIYEREFVIGSKSFDFKVGDYLIEINPTATHNSTYGVFGDCKPLDKDYHKNKSILAEQHGFRCIHVFDWDNVYKILDLLQSTSREIVYARKCEIYIVDKEIAKAFINDNHLQGYARDEIRLGLFYNNELVSIMTFGKPRYNKNFEYELIRYCSSKNIIGGAEKLFKYFLNNYNPTSIISYCDKSKFNGSVYTKLGFSYKTTNISRHWYNIKTNEHILDSLLRQRGFDQLLGSKYGCYGKGTSNEQLMLEHGFVEIYDVGQARYEYFK